MCWWRVSDKIGEENFVKNSISDEMLIDLYCNKKLSIAQISKLTNCYWELIGNRLKSLNIPVRSGNYKDYYDTRKKNRKLCEVCNAIETTEYKNTGKFYCSKHYSQITQYGRILERTKFEPNEVIFKDNYYIMKLYNAKHDIVGECYFDKDDYDKVKEYKWHLDRQGYVVTRLDKKRISMHRLILAITNDNLIDHINLNKADNRRNNLRIVDKSKNEMNKPVRSNNSSGVKGVCYYNSKNKWSAEIDKNGVKFRKLFNTFDDAVQYRIIKETELFKNYSNNYNHNTNTIQLIYLSHDDNKQTYIEVDMDGNIIKFEKL